MKFLLMTQRTFVLGGTLTISHPSPIVDIIAVIQQHAKAHNGFQQQEEY